MSVYSCSRCKDTGTIKDDASWGENGGCTYVCNCMYGKRAYHQPLPPRPSDAFLMDRAEKEHPERFTGYNPEDWLDCSYCGEATQDFSYGANRCRTCDAKEDAASKISLGNWLRKYGIELQRPKRKEEQEVHHD